MLYIALFNTFWYIFKYASLAKYMNRLCLISETGSTGGGGKYILFDILIILD